MFFPFFCFINFLLKTQKEKREKRKKKCWISLSNIFLPSNVLTVASTLTRGHTRKISRYFFPSIFSFVTPRCILYILYWTARDVLPDVVRWLYHLEFCFWFHVAYLFRVCINTRQFHGEEQGEKKNNGDEQCPKLPFQNCSMDFFSLNVKILKKGCVHYFWAGFCWL
jgi:hypothetical protein